MILLCFYSTYSKTIDFQREVNPETDVYTQLTYYNNNIYCIVNPINNCKYQLQRINLENNHIDTAYYTLPQAGKYNCMESNHRINNFIIENDTIYLLFGDLIVINKLGDYENGSYIDLREETKRERKQTISNKLKKYKNGLLGYSDSYITIKGYYNSIFVWKYDNPESDIDTISIPNINGFQWVLMQPKNIFDATDELMAYCDIEDDKLYLFNDINKIDTLDLNIFTNKISVGNDFKFSHPAEFYTMNEVNRNEMYLIHKINFLDENNILVCYSVPKTENTDLVHIFNFCMITNSEKNAKINSARKWIVKDKIPAYMIFGNGLEDDNIYGANYNVFKDKIISNYYKKGTYNNKYYKINDIKDVLDRIK